jgi:hypothetical protein
MPGFPGETPNGDARGAIKSSQSVQSTPSGRRPSFGNEISTAGPLRTSSFDAREARARETVSNELAISRTRAQFFVSGVRLKKRVSSELS